MSAIFIDCPPHEAEFLTPELQDIVPGLAVNTGTPPLHALLIRNVSYHACFRRVTGPGADIGNPTRMAGRRDKHQRDCRSSLWAALAR